MSELVLGTKKGMFVLDDGGSGSEEFGVALRAFAGEPVEFATRDPRTGRYFAAMTSPFYGPKIFYTDDLGAEWSQADGVALPEDSGAALERIWVITPGEEEGLLYAGGDPGVLFESRDGGASWQLNEALWNEPSRPGWQAGGGGLCLHSIVPWPGDPQRLLVAISAAGVWITEDGGKSWRRGNRGLHPRYLPEAPAQDDDGPIALCVHHIERSPARPERLFMQFHGGVYRSDDAGESWSEIGRDLVSDFGFPLTVHPEDPDRAYVIPLKADMDRVTPEGQVRVFETRDGGETWSAQRQGLPQEHAYLTVLRLAFTRADAPQGFEMYFGSTTGEVFGTRDGGERWFNVASRLPPVYSVVAS